MKRQVAYWGLLASAFGREEFGGLNRELATELELPLEVLDPGIPTDVLLRRYPELKPHFDLEHGDDQDLRRTLCYSKLLLNVFGPNTQGDKLTANQFSQWGQDRRTLEESLKAHGLGPGGNQQLVDDERLRQELVAMESDLIKRMDLREVLADDRLAAQLTPSMAIVEQLLYDKSNLSAKALANAKAIIRKYVDDLAAVLKKQVVSTKSGIIDRSVPPKRVFRNLDLKRTVWKNLSNYREEKLYVQQLYYRHTSQKSLNKHLIVVVDQSGSMVSEMVQCAILASIFAALPRVEVAMVAFDTRVVDLTPWVADPLEALLRTNLGGGNYGPVAMEYARTLITDSRRTTMVWISDFYDDRSLLPMFKALKESGVHFIPVGSVSGKGYFNVDGWFQAELKKLGLPILTGNIKKLIGELKKQLT